MSTLSCHGSRNTSAIIAYVNRKPFLTCLCLDDSHQATQIAKTPSPYHLLDHEYGVTPKDQIITRPLLSPVKTELCVRMIFTRKYLSTVANHLLYHFFSDMFV